MKTILLVLVCVVATSSVASAQAARETTGARIRNAGIATVIISSLVFTTGFIVTALYTKDDNATEASMRTQTIGLAVTAVGQTGLLVGIPLWAGGARLANRPKKVQLTVTAAGLRGSF